MMFDKKIKRPLLGVVLLVVLPAYAEVFIVNTGTIDNTQQTPQPQFSLSNIDVAKIRLLQHYGYAERAAVSNRRRQNLSLVASQLAGWQKSGAPSQSSLDDIKKSLTAMEAEIRQSVALPGDPEVPELKQLHENEQKNAQTVQALLLQADKIKVAGEERATPARKDNTSIASSVSENRNPAPSVLPPVQNKYIRIR